ncbi:MAG: hypothetical protein JW914_00485 [Syntrophaceae bacterium]|nr:hypothetical protein [Syntrophaceae bacterium]
MKLCRLFLLIFFVFISLTIQAMAADVKFSGTFYAGGIYLDETSFRKNDSSSTSTAFYFQRLRVQTEFIVTPALKLVTRFDVMERIWGGIRSTPGIAPDSLSAGTRAENENIAFDWAYIHFASKLGLWRVGYMPDGAWGTVFADTTTPAGVIALSYATGPWYFIIKTVKLKDNSYSAVNTTTTATDVDTDKYAAAFKYSWKGGSAGVLGGIGRDASKKPANHYLTLTYSLTPYVIAHIGPVKLQAEVSYAWGKLCDYDNGTSDIKLKNLGAFVDAVADLNMFYVGGTLAYVSGDKPSTTSKYEGGRINGGADWNPCLLLWNYDRSYWVGTLYGHGGVAPPPVDTRPQNASPISNAWFGQLRGGIRPINTLDIMASVSYAEADQKPWATAGDPTSVYHDKDYGVEIDVTATYKITNNLSYMAGFGYLFTGDYFKGAETGVSVSDNYLLINKLTLTF